MNLYNTHAQEFSKTRQSPWAGWLQTSPFLKKHQPLSVLDVGCGNARFLSFMQQEEIIYKNYLGIDNSTELIQIAKDAFSGNKDNFEIRDVETESILQFKDSTLFNCIVLFGLMHHIRSKDKRKQLIDDAFTLIQDSGIVIITFWQFKSDTSFFNSHVVEDLQNNDYILRFGKEAIRFCHHTTDEEIAELLADIPATSISTQFKADGKNQHMNAYVILEKIRESNER